MGRSTHEDANLSQIGRLLVAVLEEAGAGGGNHGPLPRMMRIAQACEHLGIGETKFREEVREGRLTAYRIRGCVLYCTHELNEWADAEIRKIQRSQRRASKQPKK